MSKDRSKKEEPAIKIDVSALYETCAYLLAREFNRMLVMYNRSKDIKERSVIKDELTQMNILLDKLNVPTVEEVKKDTDGTNN